MSLKRFGCDGRAMVLRKLQKIGEGFWQQRGDTSRIFSEDDHCKWVTGIFFQVQDHGQSLIPGRHATLNVSELKRVYTPYTECPTCLVSPLAIAW
jgi:hypothetical protein